MEKTVLEESIIHISCESQKGEPFCFHLPGLLHQLDFSFSGWWPASYKDFVKVLPRFSEQFHSRFGCSSRLGELALELLLRCLIVP